MWGRGVSPALGATLPTGRSRALCLLLCPTWLRVCQKKKKKTAKTLSPGTGVEKEHANSTNSSSKTRGNVSAVAKSADGAVAATGSDSSLLPVKPSCLAPRGLGRGQVYFSHFLSRLSSHLADCSCALRGRTDGPAPAGSSSREGHEEANGVF